MISAQAGVSEVTRIDFERGEVDIVLHDQSLFDDKKLDLDLREAGYELHPVGHVTKKMKAMGGGAGGRKKSSGSGSPFGR